MFGCGREKVTIFGSATIGWTSKRLTEVNEGFTSQITIFVFFAAFCKTVLEYG
jgi:hypothetical protein